MIVTYTRLSARELQVKNLKLKGLDGVPYRPRGACPIIDTPRSTRPQLANIFSLYTAVDSLPYEGPIVDTTALTLTRQVKV